MDQGRGRSVAPTRLILRPQTRYKGRGLEALALNERYSPPPPFSHHSGASIGGASHPLRDRVCRDGGCVPQSGASSKVSLLVRFADTCTLTSMCIRNTSELPSSP